MSLTATEISAVVNELASALTGGWIQKIHQPLPRVVTLTIRTPGATHTVLLSVQPETARLHLTTRRLQNPPAPPPFCQFLRARIEGARIEAIEQLHGDRIVQIRLTARRGPCAIIAELIGRNADVLLLDGSGTVLADLNHDRNRIGQPYRLPPASGRKTLDAAIELPPAADAARPAFPVSTEIDARYRWREAELAVEWERQARLADIRKRLRQTVRRIEALQADLNKAEHYRDYSRYGELLKANLGKIVAGQDCVTVIDYFDERLPEITIPLDPSKGPRSNMDDYFKKHRKYLAAEREIRPRLEAAQHELERLRTELESLQRGTWHPTSTQGGPYPAMEGKPSARRQRFSAIGGQPSGRTGPFRRFISSDGLPIYVGRNARENEELTFGLAKGDDLWLHARGAPGSHVVVRLEKGATPPPETLKDAAALALLYSDLKKSGKGEVMYTRRKWVRKVNGQPPGTVMVTQEQSLFVSLDNTRLDALRQRSSLKRKE